MKKKSMSSCRLRVDQWTNSLRACERVMPSFSRPSVRPARRPVAFWQTPAAPTTSSNGGVASIRLNSVAADCGAVDVALNAVMLYSVVPLLGPPTSERGIVTVIVPVLGSYDACDALRMCVCGYDRYLVCSPALAGGIPAVSPAKKVGLPEPPIPALLSIPT